jgi:predicted DNA-binding transcriptional regulator YafY
MNARQGRDRARFDHSRDRAAGLEEIEGWILSWGRHVQVIEPAELGRRVRAEARAVAER